MSISFEMAGRQICCQIGNCRN